MSFRIDVSDSTFLARLKMIYLTPVAIVGTAYVYAKNCVYRICHDLAEAWNHDPVEVQKQIEESIEYEHLMRQMGFAT